MYLDDGITFSSSDIDIPGCARWLFIAASHKSTISSYTILHASRSFEKFRNEHTTILLDRLRVVVHNWLDPHSVTPLAVPGRYQLVSSIPCDYMSIVQSYDSQNINLQLPKKLTYSTSKNMH